MELMECYKFLPDTIIHAIVNYTNVVVYRNGKYINRLNLNQNKYDAIKAIPRPIYVGNHKILIKIITYDLFGCIIEYNISEPLFKLNIQFFYLLSDSFERHYEIKSNNNYVLDINNKWHKTINYFI